MLEVLEFIFSNIWHYIGITAKKNKTIDMNLSKPKEDFVNNLNEIILNQLKDRDINIFNISCEDAGSIMTVAAVKHVASMELEPIILPEMKFDQNIGIGGMDNISTMVYGNITLLPNKQMFTPIPRLLSLSPYLRRRKNRKRYKNKSTIWKQD